ncbi:hypothetical protein NDU88_004220 [Pleurodeles waltl]|uniref:Uncharacterized protein n=1 Tax=Pleurodeles waltl TaxID=8319 RepID=A0AAV7RF59_PLEWA|nr:hypothetical protein NDU88_004220 [Pleurodeles waltl]
MVTSVRVLEALKVLQEEGREDLLQQGVLDQEVMGLKRPRGASSEGVAAAVIAYSSPVSGKKYKQKSVMGWRYAQIRQCVASRGRGAADHSAVVAVGRLGSEARVTAHAPASRKKAVRLRQQAPLSSRNIGERAEGVFEKRPLAEGCKMAARIEDRQEPILIESDSDGDDPLGNVNIKGAMRDMEPVRRKENNIIVQWVPRLVSPMLHKVQHWDVENRTLIQTGQLVEVMDKGESRVASIAFEELS